ncbi:hypothetical protein IMZ48_39680 [Candidatus Bathyarchaeota archaeon]|nr:hypothetical protein [Candidatus Bathyarchaeota archaeon]
MDISSRNPVVFLDAIGLSVEASKIRDAGGSRGSRKRDGSIDGVVAEKQWVMLWHALRSRDRDWSSGDWRGW